MKRVLVITRIHTSLENFLKDRGYSIDFGEDTPVADLYNLLHQYEGIVTSTKLKFDREVLDKASHLKWIARMGSGMEQIDLLYAQERGIHCISSPEGNANAVAEQALGMLLSLKHNILRGHLELKDGVWQREENRGYEIEGKNAGIIGLGNNGMAFAKKLALLGCNVLGYDIEPKPNLPAGVLQATDIAELYNTCDIISFHVPYNKETHHYFDQQFLIKMRHPFVLLNLSRGKIVAQSAVLEGLQSGKLVGAALDVWEQEPISKMPEDMIEIAHSLLSHPQFIGTPHIGGYTHEAIYKMSHTLQLKLEDII
jgi:D-3-phosphoglycerate dehydrogenase